LNITWWCNKTYNVEDIKSNKCIFGELKSTTHFEEIVEEISELTLHTTSSHLTHFLNGETKVLIKELTPGLSVLLSILSYIHTMLNFLVITQLSYQQIHKSNSSHTCTLLGQY
jgi:phosphoribosylpyrophosphate synthetase